MVCWNAASGLREMLSSFDGGFMRLRYKITLDKQVIAAFATRKDRDAMYGYMKSIYWCDCLQTQDY